MISLYWKVLFSLAFILSVMLGILFFLKRIGKYNASTQNLFVEESLNLDGKRKIILLRYKDNRYLILVGENTDLVIKQEDAD